MKSRSYYKILMFTLLTAGIYSCKDMMDVHQEYIKNGETVYLTKMNSLVSYAGKGRIKISGALENAYNVNKIKVYWNNKADSASFDYTKKSYVDTVDMIIPNLPEKSYVFDVYTINNDGNKSVKVPVSGTVYGSRYRSGISPRLFFGFNYDGKKMISSWLSADELERGTQLKYTTNKSELKTVFLSRDSAKVALPDLKFGTIVSYRSVFIPEEDAIDTICTSWSTVESLSIASYTNIKLGGWDSNYPSCMDAETGVTIGGLGSASEERKKTVDIYFEDSKLGCTDLDSLEFDNGARFSDTGTRYAKTSFTSEQFEKAKNDNLFKDLKATLKEIQIKNGDIVFFITRQGKKGLLRIINMTDPRGDLILDEKIQY